jgi:hypothetical protein
MTILNNHRICTSALLLILQRGYDYYVAKKKLAMQYGSAKRHGNVGRKRGVVDDTTLFPPLNAFFSSLLSLCEVRATETVPMVGLRNSTEDIDKVYLPTYMSIHGCYAMYLNQLGYDIKTHNDGSYEVSVSAAEDGDKEPTIPPPYVSLPTFYNVWRKDFGHIKVSRPSEDICNQCCAFANRHRYKSGPDDSPNSEADASLFLEPPPFSDFDSDSDEEEEYNNDKPEEEPTIESNEQPTQKSAVQELLENNDAVAEDPTLEEREQMIGRAYLHVEMARAQRVLYANLISKARRDALDKVEHNKRTYTFVVDYGQSPCSTKSNRGPVITTVL